MFDRYVVERVVYRMKKSTQRKRSKADERSGTRSTVTVKTKAAGKQRNRVTTTGTRATKASKRATESGKTARTKERSAPQKRKVCRTAKKRVAAREEKCVKKDKKKSGRGTMVDASISDEKKPTVELFKRKRRGKRGTRGDKGSTRLTRIDAFKRLKELPNFEVLHHKIVSNVSPQSIATFIQDDCGLCDNINHRSLVTMLYRYKRSIPYEERTPREMTALARRTEQFPHELSVLEETTRLYELQTTRVAVLIELEDDAGEPLRALGVEMDRGMKYLEQIMSLKEKLGLIGDHGEQLSAMDLGDTLVSGAMAVITKKYGDGAQAKLAFIGKKLHEALKQLTVTDGKPVLGRIAPATRVVSAKDGVEVHEVVPTTRPDRPEGPQPGPGEGVVPLAPDLPTEGDSLAPGSLT